MHQLHMIYVYGLKLLLTCMFMSFHSYLRWLVFLIYTPFLRVPVLPSEKCDPSLWITTGLGHTTSIQGIMWSLYRSFNWVTGLSGYLILSHDLSFRICSSRCWVEMGSCFRWAIGGPGFKPVNTPAARHDLKMCQGDRIKIGGNCHFYCHQSIDISQRHQIHNMPMECQDSRHGMDGLIVPRVSYFLAWHICIWYDLRGIEDMFSVNF